MIDGEPLDHPKLDRAFNLTGEAPLRLVLGAGGIRLAVVGHHAAFDGLALVAILTTLAGGDLPRPVSSPLPGEPGSKLPLLTRLARPAGRVAPTPGVWPSDAYATETISVRGPNVTGAITAACVAAVIAHNEASVDAERLDKIGVTVAVGGPAGVGNVASYRRIDVAPDGPIAKAVADALASPKEPASRSAPPRQSWPPLRR